MRRAGLLLVLFVGCVDARSFEAPAGYRYFAFVDGDGNASPLYDLAGGAKYPLTVRSDNILYGWTEEQLAGFAPPAVAPLEKKVSACEPALPEPAYMGTFEGRTATGDSIALTAEWIGCPETPNNVLFLDDRCDENACTTTISVDRCRVTLDRCDGRTLGRVDPEGHICFEKPGCTSVQSASIGTIVGTNHCGETSCPLELHDVRRLEPSRFLPCAPGDSGCRLLLPKLGDEPYNRTPKDLALIRGEIDTGFAQDLVLLEDRALVLQSQIAIDRVYCPFEAIITLYEIDLETLAIIASRPAPFCATRMIKVGGRLLFSDAYFPATLILTELDGTVVQSVELTLAGDTGASVNAMVWFDELDLIAVLLNSASAIARYEISIFDENTLQLIDSTGVIDAASSTMARLDATSVMLRNDTNKLPEWYRFTRASVIFDGIGNPTGSAHGDAISIERSSSVLTLMTGVPPAIELRSRLSAQRASSFNPYAIATAAAELEGDAIAVALSEAGETKRTAHVYVAHDHDALRFEPAGLAIGEGLITRLRVDRKGRLWALLSWTGELVRLSRAED